MHRRRFVSLVLGLPGAGLLVAKINEPSAGPKETLPGTSLKPRFPRSQLALDEEVARAANNKAFEWLLHAKHQWIEGNEK
jgi:hypothetical protein